MPVYMIVAIEEINDLARYKEYIAQVPAIVAKYGGRYVARGGEIIPFAGDWEPKRVIVIEFPSKERALSCFGSDEYKRVAPLREESTVTRAIFVEAASLDTPVPHTVI